MKRLKYEKAEMNITVFRSSDVMSASHIIKPGENEGPIDTNSSSPTAIDA